MGNLAPIWSKNMQPSLMIHSLRIYLKFCDMMRHQTKVALVNFSRKFLFWEIYTTNCSREFQKHSSMMWCNSQTLVRFVNFPEKLLFRPVSIQAKMVQWCNGPKFGSIYATLYLLEMLQDDGLTMQTYVMVVNFPRKIPFWRKRVIQTQICPDFCQVQYYDLL